MTTLCLDIGDVRTGVAISNEVSSICSPLDYIKSDNNLVQKISELINVFNHFFTFGQFCFSNHSKSVFANCLTKGKIAMSANDGSLLNK